MTLAVARALTAQTAILESLSGVRQPGQVRFSFRTSPAAPAKPATATFVVHLATGAAPESVEILKPRRIRAEARVDEKGWITVRIPPDIASRLITKPGEWLVLAEPAGTAFDLPSRSQFAPYLVVEARSAAK